MMKLSRLLVSRGNTIKRAGHLGDAFQSHPFSSRAGISTAGQKFIPQGNTVNRIFAPFNVFKSKVALSVNPVLPTFTKLDSGNLAMGRRGSVMLKFMPSVGDRKYDREKSQIFALSATEVGTLISLGPNGTCEFFHDPSMLSSNAGQVRKSLSIKPAPDGNGYFISLNVVNNVQKTRESFSIPLTVGEFAVMKTACSFALPHILGWDQLTKSPKCMDEGFPSSKKDPRFSELEWEK